MLGRRTSGVRFKGGKLLLKLDVLVLGTSVVVLVLVLVLVLVVVLGGLVVLFGPKTTDSLIDSRATIQGGSRGLAVDVSLASTQE